MFEGIKERKREREQVQVPQNQKKITFVCVTAICP